MEFNVLMFVYQMCQMMQDPNKYRQKDIKQNINTMQTMSIESPSTKQSESKQINWHEYNYPPILNLMHFRPSELPDDRRSLVIMLFVVHIMVLVNCILNIIDNCIEGGLGILYSFLFLFIFNPIVIFLFYRAYIGLCKEKAKLGLFIYLWPLVIIIMIVISIVDFLGFNGFIRVSNMFKAGSPLTAVFGLIISIIWLVLAIWSGFLYFKIFKEKSILTKALL